MRIRGRLLLEQLTDGVKDRFNCLSPLLTLDGVFDDPVNGPDLLCQLGFRDGCQHLVAGRNEVLHKDVPLPLVSRLGQIFPLLEDGHFEDLGGQFDDDLGGPSELAAALKGRKQASINVAAWGTQDKSLAAVAATNSGLWMTS